MGNKQSRLGFIWPGGGAEQDFYRFFETAGDSTRLFLSCTRVGGDGTNDHDIAALQRTASLSWLVEAANRFQSLNLDCVYWPCTSGSFVLGRAHAENQIKVLRETVGVQAGSTSLAFIAAAKKCRFSKVSVLSTYPEAASQAFINFLEEFDIAALNMIWLNAASGWDAAVFESEFIIEKIPKAIHKNSDALLIPDTAMPSLFSINEFEQVAGIPVLTANGVTVWDALLLMQQDICFSGFGSLLSGSQQ